MGSKANRRAIELLNSSDILTQYKDQIEKNGVVGEELNRLALILVFTSRLNLSGAVSCAIKDQSSSGKNSLINAALKLFPTECFKQFSRITPEALFHGDSDLSHKILIVDEFIGASPSLYTLKLGLSEGRLIKRVTTKSYDDGFGTQDYSVTAKSLCFVTTSTKDVLDYELDTRMIHLKMDTSAEQTRRIYLSKANYMPNGNIEEENIIFQGAQNLLKPYDVYIPFGVELANTFPAESVTGRRDFSKYLNLIKSSAILHQFQRDKKELHGREILIANESDKEIVSRLYEHVFGKQT